MSGNFQHLRDELIHQGHVVGFYNSYFSTPDGDEMRRDVVKHPGAVSAVALEDTSVWLVKQFRAPIRNDMWELPAGKLDIPGEPLEETVVRELEEEIGRTSAKVEFLISLHHSPGFCDEHQTIFLCTELSEVPVRHDGPEEAHMLVEKFPLRTAVEMALRRFHYRRQDDHRPAGGGQQAGFVVRCWASSGPGSFRPGIWCAGSSSRCPMTDPRSRMTSGYAVTCCPGNKSCGHRCVPPINATRYRWPGMSSGVFPRPIGRLWPPPFFTIRGNWCVATEPTPGCSPRCSGVWYRAPSGAVLGSGGPRVTGLGRLEVFKKLGQYRIHPELGRDLLGAAGSDDFTAAWAGEHHAPVEKWTVDPALGHVLKECDDD